MNCMYKRFESDMNLFSNELTWVYVLECSIYRDKGTSTRLVACLSRNILSMIALNPFSCSLLWSMISARFCWRVGVLELHSDQDKFSEWTMCCNFWFSLAVGRRI